MTHQEASAVVRMSVAEVEDKLRQIEEWPRFLVGLEDVTKTSFERYRFRLRSGQRTREAQVAVMAHPREHRIAWKALAGPAFSGVFRLQPVDGRHTRVSLWLKAEPAGFLAGLSDMLGSSTSTAMLDLQRMEAYLTGATAAPEGTQG